MGLNVCGDFILCPLRVSYTLGEYKALFEFFLDINCATASVACKLVYKPLKVALNDTLSGDCVLCQNSIQAAFSGCCFIATAVHFHEILTNGCDMVPIKVHIGRLSFRRIDHFCIVFFPILTLQDRVIHGGFDLTHWRDCVCSANLLPLQQPEPPPCASGQTGWTWPESVEMGSRCGRLRSQANRG